MVDIEMTIIVSNVVDIGIEMTIIVSKMIPMS